MRGAAWLSSGGPNTMAGETFIDLYDAPNKGDSENDLQTKHGKRARKISQQSNRSHWCGNEKPRALLISESQGL